MAEEPKKEEETKGDEAESSGLAAPPPAAPMSLMDQLAAMSKGAENMKLESEKKSEELGRKVTKQRRKSRDLEQVVFGMNMMESDQLKKIFDEIDEDKSGTIEVTELRAALTKAGKQATDAQVKKIIEKYATKTTPEGAKCLAFDDYRKMIGEWDSVIAESNIKDA